MKDLCGIPKEYNRLSNIFMPSVMNSWSTPYVTCKYKEEVIFDEETEKMILKRYKAVVMSWI